MDRYRPPSPPGEKQPGWAPPCPSCPLGIPVAAPPLSYRARKTLSLDSISSHIPLPLSQAGARVRPRSLTPRELGTARGAILHPTGSPVPRKFSSLSFTLQHHSPIPVSPPNLEAAGRDKAGAAQGKGEPPVWAPPPLSLVPITRTHSIRPATPRPIRPTGAPVLEKPLLTSHMTLSFQPRSAQSLPSAPGPGLPFRSTSPGRVGTRHLGIPRLQLPTGRGLPAPRLFKSKRITLVRPERANSPGRPGPATDPAPATSGVTMEPAVPDSAMVSSASSVDVGPVSPKRAKEPALIHTPQTTSSLTESGGIMSPRESDGTSGTTGSEIILRVEEADPPSDAQTTSSSSERCFNQPKKVSFSISTSPKMPHSVKDPEEKDQTRDPTTSTKGEQPKPGTSPKPATSRARRSLRSPKGSKKGTAVPPLPHSMPQPGQAPSTTDLSTVMLDKSTSTCTLKVLPDPEDSCTMIVPSRPCSSTSLTLRGTKVIFTVPGLGRALASPGTPRGLPGPRRAPPCTTTMFLVTSQKGTVTQLAYGSLAMQGPMPTTNRIGADMDPFLGIAEHTQESDSPGTALAPLGMAANRTAEQDALDALDLAMNNKGLGDSKTEVTMSELVAEARPKPAVPMKPLGISSNLLGYIGIDTIIEQMRKKTMKTGFDFNIMVVGQSGLGKSTLINTLFKSQVSRKSASWSRDEKIPKTVEIKAIGHVIEEGGVKMKLTVIDTPGFGDQINNENCWEPIEKYINEQYEKFLKEEVNIARKKRIPDTRVHCCLYFISPTGHSLRPLDLEFMRHLSKVVNIIPIIAKADTMTLEEKMEFKQRVRKELEVNGIEFYPQKEFDEDLEDKTENDKIRQESMPFAVVGSDKEYQVNGKRVLGRKTPWGIIEVENLTHCEFALLRDFVIRTHLQDLKEVTHNIHYETYRARRLNDNGGLPPAPHPSNFTSFKGLEK